jgi:DNA-binding transcriptional MerR regulator/methylmalonyl-CoA mutase cobalamin-binding subunit
MENRHSIKAVASRTGLSPHVIRVWERRYGAVKPARTDTNRRLYSDQDIERLRLLRQATLAGESIGQIAGLSTEDLRRLLPEDEPHEVLTGTADDSDSRADFYLRLSMEAVLKMDMGDLESTLLKAYVSLGQPLVLEKVVRPFLQRIGEMWEDGSLKVMHEHMVSAVVRTFLGHMVSSGLLDPTAPALVATTPAGVVHEFGALMAAVIAAARGWRAIYLGPNSPAQDIAVAAAQSNARAVALSIIYPADDPQVKDELRHLGQLLEPGVNILVGGRCAPSYMDVLDEIGARLVPDMGELDRRLATLNAARMAAIERGRRTGNREVDS